MKTHELSLPLEYNVMPQYFDTHNIGDDTEAKNAVIENLLRNHNVHNVLDVTCGTGSQVFYLAERGYNVVGADFSPELIKIAKQKAIAQHRDITFLDADMRSINAGHFDAVISIFNAIGHLSKEDFAQAVHAMYSNLYNHGIVLFDIFNLQAITEETVQRLSMDFTKTVGETSIRNQQSSTLDATKGLLTSYDHYTITTPGKAEEKIDHHFTLQIYTATEIEDILQQQGFYNIQHYSLDGSAFDPNTTLNMLTLAHKKEK